MFSAFKILLLFVTHFSVHSNTCVSLEKTNPITGRLVTRIWCQVPSRLCLCPSTSEPLSDKTLREFVRSPKDLSNLFSDSVKVNLIVILSAILVYWSSFASTGRRIGSDIERDKPLERRANRKRKSCETDPSVRLKPSVLCQRVARQLWLSLSERIRCLPSLSSTSQ